MFNREQQAQLEHVIQALASDFYHPLGEISLSGFKAEGPLSLEEAEKQARQPIPEGTIWGQPWEYCWMFGEFTLPDTAAGERIVMNLNPGGESTLFLNGKAFGTRRRESVHYPHHYICDQILTDNAEGGEHFSLALEAYGGTPQTAAPGQPVLPERGIAWEQDQPAVMGENSFGLWNEEAYQLWLDLTMLREIHDGTDENDFLRERIGTALDEVLDTLDLEQPLPQRRRACVKAREILSPVMNAHNGTFAASMGVIGNSHLDLAWLWPLEETRRKTARTFAQQLRLLKEYPEARFLQSQCAEYELCRQYYPELFEEIRQAVRDGQWIAEGGTWVEPDTNLAGGEAIVRQLLYGKKYFRDVLGVDSQVVWLPDSFGYSAALPQIIHLFRMTGLTTQKIFWSYNDSEPFPYHAFRWKGMDGTEVPSYLHMAYETAVNAATLRNRWNSRVCKDGSGDFYLPFGYGDGGGGPCRDDLEQIRRQQDLQGSPKLYYMAPGEYLQKRNQEKLPVYRGELYFPCHRGTYTSQAKVKKNNRMNEMAMRSWEMLASMAAWNGKAAYPAEELEATWKQLLVNQFHDILPGSSIGRVYQEANALHDRIHETAARGIGEALAAFRTGAEGTTLFNAGTCACERMVEMDPAYGKGAVDEQGNPYPAMAWKGKALVAVKLPALGAITLFPAETKGEAPVSVCRVAEGYRFENEAITALINERGQLVSLMTKADGLERIHAVSNCFHLYRDLPRRYDAWDIDSQTENRELHPEMNSTVEIISAGGLRAGIRVVTRFSNSVIDQTITLDACATRLDFDTSVDWHERHRLLKVSFDSGIEALEASHQIQFGWINRPAHRSRQYDKDRFEVCNHAWTALYDSTHGAALLNDCKYGVSAEDGVIALSLLRAPTYPDAEADLGAHSFRYAWYVFDGSLPDSEIQMEAERLNIPVYQAEGTCRIPALLSPDDLAVTVESVKLAEDGSGDLIIRLYENMNGRRTVSLCPGFAWASANQCWLSEEIMEPADPGKLSFRPFEIKTIRFTR